MSKVELIGNLILSLFVCATSGIYLYWYFKGEIHYTNLLTLVMALSFIASIYVIITLIFKNITP